MEEQGVVLRSIARFLNAGGSALLSIYDAVTSTRIGFSVPGEKEKLKGEIREYTNKIERLYYEIGKEVSQSEDSTRVSPAGEASVKLVAEYREHIETIKRRLEEIEAAEKIERQRLLEEREAARRTSRQEAGKQTATTSRKAAPEQEAAEETSAAETEPVAVAEPSPLTEVPLSGEAPMDAATEEVREVVAEAVETADHEPPEEASAAEPSVASEELAGTETEEDGEATAEVPEAGEAELHKYTAEELENMIKRDLLALCTGKGIEADMRMTKARMVELILGTQSE